MHVHFFLQFPVAECERLQVEKRDRLDWSVAQWTSMQSPIYSLPNAEHANTHLPLQKGHLWVVENNEDEQNAGLAGHLSQYGGQRLGLVDVAIR